MSGRTLVTSAHAENSFAFPFQRWKQVRKFHSDLKSPAAVRGRYFIEHSCYVSSLRDRRITESEYNMRPEAVCPGKKGRVGVKPWAGHNLWIKQLDKEHLVHAQAYRA